MLINFKYVRSEETKTRSKDAELFRADTDVYFQFAKTNNFDNNLLESKTKIKIFVRWSNIFSAKLPFYAQTYLYGKVAIIKFRKQKTNVSFTFFLSFFKNA